MDDRLTFREKLYVLFIYNPIKDNFVKRLWSGGFAMKCLVIFFAIFFLGIIWVPLLAIYDKILNYEFYKQKWLNENVFLFNDYE